MKCHSRLEGYGNLNAEVVFVLSSPSTTDLKNSQLLSGNTGQIFDAILESVNVHRGECYTTIALCTPKAQATLSDALPCIDRLFTELAGIKPKLVITIGALAAEVFWPYNTYGEIRGTCMWHSNGYYVMPVLHPGAIFQGNVGASIDLVKDLAKIPMILEWEPGGKHTEIKYKIADSYKEAQLALNTLEQESMLIETVDGGEPLYVAVDIETNIGKDEDGNLDVFEDKLLCVGIATSEFCLVVKAEHAIGLVWPKLNYVFHNASFDVQGIYRYLDTWLDIHEDTMLMSYSLDERAGHHSLKTVSREFLGVGFYEGSIKKKRKKFMGEVPFEELALYNAYDSVYTARLVPILKNLQIKDNVREMYKRLLLPAARMFAETQYRGIHIDQKALRSLGIKWMERYLTEDEFLHQMAIKKGWPVDKDLNLRSPVQLRKLLFDIMQLPYSRLTKTGEPSTDKTALDDLSLENEFVARLLGFRHLGHFISHYIQGVDNQIKSDGRVHPSVMVKGTVTGRLSIVNPPMQTIPNEANDEVYEPIREYVLLSDPSYNVLDDLSGARLLFDASDDEHVIIQADYGKAELYAAAVLSGDKNLITDLESGDFHTRAAQGYFNTVKPSEYQRSKLGKTVTFGRMYRRGWHAMSKMQLKGVDIEVIKSICLGFDKRYSTYINWSQEIMNQATEEGELTLPSGRKRRFRIIMGDQAYNLQTQAINAPIQCMATDITLDSAIEMYPVLKEKWDSYILFLVHDADLVEAPKKYLREVLSYMHETMTKSRFSSMPLEVDFKVGRSWGLGKKVKFNNHEPINLEEILQ